MTGKRKRDGFLRVACFGAVFVLLVAVVYTVLNVQKLLIRRVEKEEPKALPIVKIALAEGTTLEDIHDNKTLDHTGNELTVIAGEDELTFENVSMRGRGNISWMNDKKPYRIKFADRVDFLGLGYFKKWAFLSYDLDDSLLRGDLGYYLAKLINDEYPLSGEFVDLYVDERDLGLYFVSPTVSIDKRIVDLRDDMGILVEVDGAWYGGENYVKTKKGNYLVGKDAVVEENLDEALSNFRKAFEKFEDTVMKGYYGDVKAIVDMDSLAEYFLFSEFAQNYDAYLTSFYFYMDGSRDKIHVGPVWDFDGIAGNKRWRESRDEGAIAPTTVVTKWQPEYSSMGKGCYGGGGEIRETTGGGLGEIICRLALMPKFRELVGAKYMEKLSGKKGEVVSRIREMADYIREAAVRNNEIWEHGSFDDEVDYLVWWIGKRFDYFDELYSEEYY